MFHGEFGGPRSIPSPPVVTRLFANGFCISRKVAPRSGNGVSGVAGDERWPVSEIDIPGPVWRWFRSCGVSQALRGRREGYGSGIVVESDLAFGGVVAAARVEETEKAENSDGAQDGIHGGDSETVESLGGSSLRNFFRTTNLQSRTTNGENKLCIIIKILETNGDCPSLIKKTSFFHTHIRTTIFPHHPKY